MTHFTITIPYYESPEMLKTHLNFWGEYPWPLAGHFRAVVVDDASPRFPAKDVMKKLPLFPVELYRIKQNIPWNHAGARNLALLNIPKGWVIITDMDHVFPIQSARELVRRNLDPNVVYYPERYQATDSRTKERIKPHIDSFIMTRDTFWKIGGFDESLAGYWNGPSMPFRKAVKRMCRTEELPGVYLLRYGGNMAPDASVSQWGREGTKWDISTDKEMKRKQRQAIRNYKPKTIQFEWERVSLQ